MMASIETLERLQGGRNTDLNKGHHTDQATKILDSNYFCTVNLGHTDIRVILWFSASNPLGHLLLKKCTEADYLCSLEHNERDVLTGLRDSRYQTILVVECEGQRSPTNSQTRLEHLSSSLSSQLLTHQVTIIGVVKKLPSPKDASFNQMLSLRVSRLLTEDDCKDDRLILELQMVERSEANLKEKQQFSLALFEAVEQSNDAIQITGRDSHILYVNRSFVDLSGYTRDEVTGKPAMDILRTFDSKQENGPKGAVKRGQVWDGVCMGRRKSGSQLRQHLKLIPVKSSDQVHHHVTIQRLLSAHDDHHVRLPSPRFSDRVAPFPITKQPSFGSIQRKLEAPIMKAVQHLLLARDNPNTPPDVKDTLERCMEILSSPELYAISTPGATRSENKYMSGIIKGLLQNPTKYPLPEMEMAKMSHVHHIARNPPITPPPPVVQEALQNIETWDFDIIRLEELSNHQPLYYVGMKVFKEFEICDVLDIEETVLASWLKLMESHYHRQNPYHNSTHAADVLQATAYFLRILQDFLVSQGELLEAIEIAALLITAVIHDLDHPARTNPYLCNTKDKLAMLYNDCAVLENHHVAKSFQLTQENKEVNIYQNLDRTVYRSLRSSIIDLVLATDMAKHFEHLAKFNVSVVDGEGSTPSLSAKETHEDKAVMKRILVKCADISNPCRPLLLCKEWAQRIAEEYFAQTEEEKRRGLPVVFPDFDRHTCKLPVTQVKFIDVFISGLFDAWNIYCPISRPMELLKSNYEYWKSESPESPLNSGSDEESSN